MFIVSGAQQVRDSMVGEGAGEVDGATSQRGLQATCR